MKKSNLLGMALCLFGLGASLLTSCDKNYSLYEIDAPSDLQEKIDSIKKANDPQKGDTLYLDILTTIVGPEDNSAAWWTEFSDYFKVPSGRLLHLDFYNYTSGANNWNNWNLCVCEDQRDQENYFEYFVLRSDAYGWGNLDYRAEKISTDYDEKLGGGDYWPVFRQKMQGARVEMEIDHSKAGMAFVVVTHYAEDGTIFSESYEQPVSATNDINAFLICDGSHFVVKNAYTIPSKIEEVPDCLPVDMWITSYPQVIPLGETDVIGRAEVTVVFEDASTIIADMNDVTFNIPDLTTPGKKTIIYSYSKTKFGEYCKSIASSYEIEVVLPVERIAVTKLPELLTYWIAGDGVPYISTKGMEVTAYYENGTSGTMPLVNFAIGVLNPTEGKQAISVTYWDNKYGEVSTSFDIDVKYGWAKVGSYDFTNGWWTTFSEPDVPIASGESVSYSMMVYSDNGGNWHSPCTILRGAALNEYAVLRMDHYGWGDGYGTATLESDWNWDTFATSLNGSEVTITIKNNGNNTADVIYDVTYANGEKHFQKYLGITVNSADLQMAFVTEESCLILHD